MYLGTPAGSTKQLGHHQRTGRIEHHGCTAGQLRTSLCPRAIGDAEPEA